MYVYIYCGILNLYPYIPRVTLRIIFFFLSCTNFYGATFLCCQTGVGSCYNYYPVRDGFVDAMLIRMVMSVDPNLSKS